MRILILKTSALGDIAQSLPALAALRRAWPRARLGWVVEEAYAPLLAGHPHLDELLVVRLRAWRRRLGRAATWRALGETAERLVDFGAEVALDLMGNHKAALLAALSLAPRRVGLARTLRREPSSALWINEPLSTPAVHAVDRSLALAAALGASADEADFVAAAHALGRRRATGGRRGAAYLFLHPGAAWGNKRYPAASWAAVLRELGSRTGLAARIGAAPGEEELACEIVARAGSPAEVAAAPDLDTLIDLLGGAALVLGGDSGPVHLARTLGRPALAVMGPTDPQRHAPHGALGRAVVRRLPCSFCARRMAGVRPCLSTLEPQAVAAAAAALLADAAQRVDPLANALLE